MSGNYRTSPGYAQRLSREERRHLAGVSQLARVIYVICVRPRANQNAVASVTEDDINDCLARLHDESGLSMHLVRRELNDLMKRGMISKEYSEQAIQVIKGIH